MRWVRLERRIPSFCAFIYQTRNAVYPMTESASVIYSPSLTRTKRRVIIAGTENSCMAAVQEQQYEEFFGGFFFDEDALRYYHPSSIDEQCN